MAAWENMWATKFAPSVNEPCCWFKCGNTERRIQIVPCLKLHVLPQSGQTSCRQFLSHNIDWLILSLIKYLTTWINTTSPLFVHSDLCAVYHVMANALPWIDRVATTEWKGGGGELADSSGITGSLGKWLKVFLYWGSRVKFLSSYLTSYITSWV